MCVCVCVCDQEQEEQLTAATGEVAELRSSLQETTLKLNDTETER